MTFVIGAILILGLILLDQAIKQMVVAGMNVGDSFPIIKGFFNITSVRNTGAAWNLFDGQIIFFVIITVVSLGIFGYLFYKSDFRTKKLYSFSTSLILAGTIGNFIDRVFYPDHAVVDMFEFKFISFPVFNFADSCLVIGIILFAIDLIFLEGKRKKNGQ